MSIQYSDHIAREERPGREAFYRRYVKPGIPVVITGETAGWAAMQQWNLDYFGAVGAGCPIRLKTGNVAEGKTEATTLQAYAARLKAYVAAANGNRQPADLPYLHDVPIFHLLPQLKKDIEPFPLQYFPGWYWPNWWQYIQFFMGGPQSHTPLHFDTLYTHNLFFQVVGHKEFYLVSAKDRDKCYLYQWRWSPVDLRNPDLVKYPGFRDVTIAKVVVGPGDLLYIPPGTLHQVVGLSFSVSFNIDWHTPASVGTGLLSGFRGAPLKNVYYNSLAALGVCLKVPHRLIFPYYKSYLNYIS